MKTKNPRRQPGAGYVDALGDLYAPLNDTTPPAVLKPGCIVTCNLLPGEHLEVLAVERDAAHLRLGNGARLRVGLHRLEVVR
ncbi:hypothetical protein [Thioalkalivibrio thiocyanodenitrificans]|uniref:hypothetical protein n=1 Tax=Thioalkalivibrio thiocyanodenitrificans TaxID=243063 RepID=UPI00037F7FA2|nr:hypothetical protein [Thioalkalivibrio thiocyanodenitrificans]